MYIYTALNVIHKDKLTSLLIKIIYNLLGKYVRKTFLSLQKFFTRNSDK